MTIEATVILAILQQHSYSKILRLKAVYPLSIGSIVPGVSFVGV